MDILILCTANSCRSQMAHGFLQGLDSRLRVFSAGTRATGQLNQKAVIVMKEDGIDISRHTSDPVEMYLSLEWDYVITVCGRAKETCPAFSGKVKNRLHMGFDDPAHETGSDEYIWSRFRSVRDEIREKMQQFYTERLARVL